MSNRQDKKAFVSILSESSKEVRELSLQTRALLLEVMPDLFEVVWTTQKSAGYGTGIKKGTEHFCSIIPHRDHVNLGFNYGSELSDPDESLEGTGAQFRHIKIHNTDDLKRPEVKKLIEVASTHKVPPLPV